MGTNELTIIRASAGSGKTWRITMEYLKLLLGENNVRHRQILAVTFTNKATDEMKNRIIQELSLIAQGADTGMAQQLCSDLQISRDTLALRAKEKLASILHDFSRFTITTIDSFFQRILKAFARETGIPVMASVELQSEKILSETVDHLFLSLEEYPMLKEWLVSMSLAQVEEGRGWDIRNDIRNLGREILKENFPLKLTENPEALRERQKDFFNELSQERKGLITVLSADADKFEKLLEENHLSAADFAGKSKGIIAFFPKLRNPEFIETGRSVEACLNSTEAWIHKDSRKKEQLASLVSSVLLPMLREDLKMLKRLNSIVAVLRYYFVWGILDDLSGLMRDRAFENNIHLLSDTPKVLHALIGNNDTPFLYERAGNTWNHLMIDEFQDTSQLQWQNFVPLLGNSLGSGHPCFLVGDVKQSIYRWRNSDWKILAYDAAETFRNQCQVFSLMRNYRSHKEIIRFNNNFFRQAASIMQNLVQEELEQAEADLSVYPHLMTLIQDAYAGCEQEYAQNTQEGGWVEVTSYPEKDHPNPEFSLIAETIYDLLAQGYRQRDIAILLREKKYGRELASFLTNRQALPKDAPPLEIISGESLFLYSSPAVMVLICALRFLDDPEDSINRVHFLREYLVYLNASPDKGVEALSMDSFLQHLPKAFQLRMNELRTMPVAQACEEIIRLLDFPEPAFHAPFLEAFLDNVHQLSAVQVNDIHGFLEWWEAKGEDLALEVPEEQNAVRMMTIHKAKGLEFPVVILPDLDWNLDKATGHREIIWCVTSDPLLRKNSPVPVSYSSKLKKTLFEADYYLEKIQSFVDQMNLLYVAFTRAEKGMYLFLKKPQKAGGLKKATDLILTVTQNMQEQKTGEEDPSVTEKTLFGRFLPGSADHEAVPEETIPPPTVETGAYNLRVSGKADEYFEQGEQDQKKRIREGILLHQVFELIRTPDDLPSAIEQMILQGQMSRETAEDIRKFLDEIFLDKETASWFDASDTLKNEGEILLPDGNTRRPDRILFRQDHTLVIDYKFGQNKSPEHQKQMTDYLRLLKEAGFPAPSGVVWYVKEGSKEYVSAE